MKKIQLHITIFFFLASMAAWAQPCSKVGEAIKSFQAKDLENAKKQIEAASTDAVCTTDPATWYYKAFICKDYYRAKESNAPSAPSRDQSIEAAKKNIEIDPKNKYAEECKKIINFLSVSYYNDAAKELNDQRYQEAHENYVRYLETVKYGQNNQPDTSAVFFAGYTAYMANNFQKAKEYLNKAIDLRYNDPNAYYYLGKAYWMTSEKDKSYKVLDAGHKRFPDNKDIVLTMVNNYIEDGKLKDLEATLDKAILQDNKNLDLKITLAIVCEKLFETQGNNSKYFDKAEKLYKDIIRSDSNNWKANYNLGIMYYNKAVNIIDKLDPDTDIKEINAVQEKCAVIFKQSLPYMLKANTIDPTKVEVWEGLAGIYFGLNEYEKSNFYKKKAEELAKRKANKK